MISSRVALRHEHSVQVGLRSFHPNMGLAGLGNQIQNGIAAGPQLASEMAQTMLLLPDPDQVRRLSGLKALNEIFTVSDSNLDNLAQAGQLRMPFAGLQFIQDKIWRSLILMTGGYGLRNLLEGTRQIDTVTSGEGVPL